jgi:DDE superfamily endonuclease
VYPRQRSFWEDVVNDVWHNDGANRDRMFLENFRLSHRVFHLLCDELRVYIQRQHTNYRAPFSVEQRVAAGLVFLARGPGFRLLAQLLGVGVATAHQICMEVFACIRLHLMPKYIVFPTGTRLAEVTEDFKQLGWPNAVGIVDGSHIPIRKPRGNSDPYHCRKGFYSIVLQGIVDAQARFLNIAVGYPGRTHDARCFFESAISDAIAEGKALVAPPFRVGNVDVYPYLMGDSAYRLTPYLMKPYNRLRAQGTEVAFNREFSKRRQAVERAYGMLKGRFSILQRAMDCRGARQIDKYVTIVSACCVLHNFCASHNDVLDENLVFRERQFAPLRPDDNDAGSSLLAADLQPAALRRRFTADAKRIRDALKDYVVPPLGY